MQRTLSYVVTHGEGPGLPPRERAIETSNERSSGLLLAILNVDCFIYKLFHHYSIAEVQIPDVDDFISYVPGND